MRLVRVLALAALAAASQAPAHPTWAWGAAALGAPDADGESSNASWGLAAMGVPDAWARGAAGAGARVAIIEPEGFDASHPFYSSRVAWCAGLSLAPGSCHAAAPASAHGTHVAGIVRQVAPDATLYLISLGDVDASPFAELRDALDLAARGPDGAPGTADDADVALLSMSIVPLQLGVPPASGIALAHAYPIDPPPGLLVVAAAGNHGGPLATVAYPAAHPATIAVAALGSIAGDRRMVAEYSSEGVEDGDDAARGAGEIDLAAPGTGVWSSLPGGAYGTMSGTSMAAPHVAGLAALHAGLHREADAAAVRAALACGAEDLVLRGRLTLPGHDASTGFGMPRATSVLWGPCLAPLPWSELLAGG